MLNTIYLQFSDDIYHDWLKCVLRMLSFFGFDILLNDNDSAQNKHSMNSRRPSERWRHHMLLTCSIYELLYKCGPFQGHLEPVVAAKVQAKHAILYLDAIDGDLKFQWFLNSGWIELLIFRPTILPNRIHSETLDFRFESRNASELFLAAAKTSAQ